MQHCLNGNSHKNSPVHMNCWFCEMVVTTFSLLWFTLGFVGVTVKKLQCQHWNMRPIDLWCSCMIQLNWKWKTDEDLYWPRSRREGTGQPPCYLPWSAIAVNGKPKYRVKAWNSVRVELQQVLALSRKREHADLSALLCFCSNISSFSILTNANTSWHTWVTLRVETDGCLYGMYALYKF